MFREAAPHSVNMQSVGRNERGVYSEVVDRNLKLDYKKIKTVALIYLKILTRHPWSQDYVLWSSN